MKPFLTTLKWESVKTIQWVAPLLIVSAVTISLLMLMPVPQDTWMRPAQTIATSAVIIAGICAMFIGIVFVAFYPAYNMAIADYIGKVVLLKRGSGFPYAYGVIVRLGLNILVAIIGYLILGFVFIAVGRLYPSDVPALATMAEAFTGVSFADLLPGTPVLVLLFAAAIAFPAVLLMMMTLIRKGGRRWSWVPASATLLLLGSSFILFFGVYRQLPSLVTVLAGVGSVMGALIISCWEQDNNAQVVVSP